MKRKAAGLDGWSSDLMLQLPDQAWDQLVSLVQQIEAKGQWPADLHHWKMTFIPKSKSSGAAAANDIWDPGTLKKLHRQLPVATVKGFAKI